MSFRHPCCFYSLQSGESGSPARSDSRPGRYTQNAAFARVLLAPFDSLLFLLRKTQKRHEGACVFSDAERVGVEPTDPFWGSTH